MLWITNLAGYIITPAITGVSSGILGLAKLIFRLGNDKINYVKKI